MHEVTKIAPSRKPGVYMVCIDNEAVILCPDDVLARWHLQTGSRLSEMEFAAFAAEAEEVLARRTALDIVAQRPLSTKQLDLALRRRGFHTAARNCAIMRMRDLGYINDATYARALVSELERRGSFGARRISEELTKRGIDRTTINATIASADIESERAKALRLARKRWRPTVPGSTEQVAATKRLAAYLQRRGFDWPVIRWCLEQVVPEVDTDIDNGLK